MLLEQQLNYIEKSLHEKGIDIKTQDYIIKYIDMNQQLFGNILDINKVIDRIINNLDSSIDDSFSSNNSLLNGRNLVPRSSYSTLNKKIGFNPLLKLKAIFSKKEKIKNDSTIMHEIDHCATTGTGYGIEKDAVKIISDVIGKNE